MKVLDQNSQLVMNAAVVFSWFSFVEKLQHHPTPDPLPCSHSAQPLLDPHPNDTMTTEQKRFASFQVLTSNMMEVTLVVLTSRTFHLQIVDVRTR